MVLSVNIPLKPSEEAIIKFLISLVFGAQSRKSTNRAQFLCHDVAGASKLIHWILNSDNKGRNSFTMVCNLVYGNTIVLEAQVARLLYDAIRARDNLKVSSFDAEESERSQRIRELMDASEPSTKKFKMPDLPGPSHIVLKQNITIPDAVSLRNSNDEQMIVDELPSVSEEDYALLFDHELPEIPEEIVPFESQLSEPRYAPVIEQILENIEISREEEKRKSFEDEMEEFRCMGIQDEVGIVLEDKTEEEEPSQIQLDDDVIIPKKNSKKTVEDVECSNADQINKIPLKEYGRMMNNFAQLHFSSAKCLIQSEKAKEMSMAELLNPIPFCLKTKCDKTLRTPFKLIHNKYDPGFLTNCNFSDEEQEDPVSASKKLRNLAPIDLLDDDPEIDEIEVPRDRIQAFLDDVDDHSLPVEMDFIEEPFVELEKVGVEEVEDVENAPEDQEVGVQMFGEEEEERAVGMIEQSTCDIKQSILSAFSPSDPLPIDLNSFIRPNSTRRDASRVFYSVLELLKERRLTASQSTAFANVELFKNIV